MNPSATAVLATAFGLAVSSSACQALNTPLYFNGPAPLLELTGLEPTPRVQSALALRFRRPTAQEQKDLDARRQALGFEVPWVSRDKVHLELLFTVKNLEQPDPAAPDAAAELAMKTATFDVQVDGANQYTKYDSNVVAAAIAAGNNTQAVYLPLLQLRPHRLGPGESYQGLLREDDFAEAESDLDAMGRWMAPFAAVLINRSEVNPVGTEMVPPGVVVPALMEVDVTLTANRHVTCEYSVRVRDDDDRLLHVDGDQRFAPTPTLFTPTLP